MRTRLLSFLLACSLIVPLPVNAAKSTTADKNATTAVTTEAKASTGSHVISNAGDSSVTQPIGDTSSYYDLEGVTNSPDITADSAYVMDATTGACLYSKQGNTTRYPASITKCMTALLVIENCNMDDIVTFSDTAVNGVEAGSSSAGINVGAKLTVEETLYAMMLVSANEAAAALAEHVAGSVDAFAEMMTARAKELGCTDTNFKNPHGLPDEEHVTTAHDMALILKQALKYDEFRKVAGAISYTIPKRDSLPQDIELWNHAKILRDSTEYYYEYAEGAKTGFTQAALNTLVTYAKKDGVELICIILKDYGADNSYYDSKALYQWAFDEVKGITPLSDYDLDADIASQSDISEKQQETFSALKPTFDSDYYIMVPKDFDGSKLTAQFTLEEDKENGILGNINIYDGETVIGTAPVTYDTSSAAGKAYISGEDLEDANTDDLQTANVDGTTITFKSIAWFIFRILLAFILVCVIMYAVRLYAESKKRKPPKRFGQGTNNNSRNNNSNSGSTAGNNTRFGNNGTHHSSSTSSQRRSSSISGGKHSASSRGTRNGRSGNSNSSTRRSNTSSAGTNSRRNTRNKT